MGHADEIFGTKGTTRFDQEGQIIIEAKDFLESIDTRRPIWPTCRNGMEVNQSIPTALASAKVRRWHPLNDS